MPSLTDLALNALLPNHCLLCGSGAEYLPSLSLCAYCWASLPRNVNACARCAVSLPLGGICGRCQTAPWPTTNTIAPLNYLAETKYLIQQLKYNHNRQAAHCLGAVLVEAVQQHYLNSSLPRYLIPIPLSYQREVGRGYNQAQWIAHVIGEQLNIPVLARGFQRHHGARQQQRSRRDRLKLAAQEFTVAMDMALPHVAIVDDVLTTGATCLALAKQINTHKATRIDFWCVARTQA